MSGQSWEDMLCEGKARGREQGVHCLPGTSFWGAELSCHGSGTGQSFLSLSSAIQKGTKWQERRPGAEFCKRQKEKPRKAKRNRLRPCTRTHRGSAGRSLVTWPAEGLGTANTAVFNLLGYSRHICFFCLAAGDESREIVAHAAPFGLAYVEH